MTPARMNLARLCGCLLLGALVLTPVLAQEEAEVGRLLMLAFTGAEPPLERLETIRPGGFIFFSNNAPSVEAVQDVTRRLQAAADYPLIFAVDQEGGPFSSFRAPEATLFPGNMALAATGDPELARRVALASAQELAHAGFTMSFAPVVDVNINPDNPIIGVRAFSAEVDTVSRFGRAYAAGLEAAGVAGVAKHFPGHGDTAVDSHLALPSVTGDRARLDKVELSPFRALIDAGVPAVMTAHVAFLALEEAVPATLSERALTGLLREELGFTGLVITDYMDMKAIANYYGPGEAAVRSIAAGADLVLLGPDRAVQDAVHEALVEAVGSGRISEVRWQDALARVARVAERYRPGWERAPSDPAPDYAAHRALAREVATRGATLLWNDGVLPLAPAADVLVVAPRPSLFGEPPHLGAVLKRYRDGVRSVLIGERPSASQIAEAVAGAQDANVVVLASYFWMGGYPAELQNLARALAATGKPVVLVSLGNPDDLRFLPARPQAYLAVYGYRESNLEGASAVLTGVARPQGKLPVAVGDYPIGSGLEDF